MFEKCVDHPQVWKKETQFQILGGFTPTLQEKLEQHLQLYSTKLKYLGVLCLCSTEQLRVFVIQQDQGPEKKHCVYTL